MLDLYKVMNKILILFSAILFFGCASIKQEKDCHLLQVVLEKVLINNKVYPYIQSEIEKGDRIPIAISKNLTCKLESKLFYKLMDSDTPKYTNEELWVNVGERFKKKYNFIELKKYTIQDDKIKIYLFYVSKNIQIQATLKKDNLEKWKVINVGLIQF